MASKLQTEILKYLKKKKVYHFKTMICNRNGISDIIGCYNGKFFAFEVKEDGDTLKPLQAYEIKQVIKSGGIALEVRNLKQVKEIIK